jgi:glycogen debranching enzyme
MDRRTFTKVSGSLLAASIAGVPHSHRARAAGQTVEDIRQYFTWDDPSVIELTEEVYQKCILDKVHPPTQPMNHNWIAPGGGYQGQWIWDTMFVVDLLSIMPGKEEVIRGVFQNNWDFQERWNKEVPDYAHDMIPCVIHSGKHRRAQSENFFKNKEWVEFPAFSQIPILAWGVERVYKRNGDKKLLKQCLKPLERFHEWYWRERDVTNIGMIAVGSYSGVVQHARWETFDFEVNMDDLKLTHHPTRVGFGQGDWYGNICVPGNTSYLVLAEKSLMRLAEIMGDKKMAARRKARIDKAEEAIHAHMWDEDAGAFLTVERDTLEKVPVTTIGSWMPLHAGIATDAQAQRMAEVLQSPSWQTPIPIPTVDPKDERFDPKGFWRGDIWPPTNYQIASGLADYGYHDLAADICDRTIANAFENGISEHYDSHTGKKLGVEFLGMTCAIVTMMIDGLTKEHTLKLSNQ